MISKVTAGIKISVATSYQPGFSDEKNEEYLFSYAIYIENHNDYCVHLLKRHWEITDGVGFIRIVDGPGVIGKQPIINPFEGFNYDSACDFHTPIGTMEGGYLFKNPQTGELFNVEVPKFTMVAPQKLN